MVSNVVWLNDYRPYITSDEYRVIWSGWLAWDWDLSIQNGGAAKNLGVFLGRNGK